MSETTAKDARPLAKRASMREVAQLAKTSTMTVSRVLSGQTERIAPETRERVLQAAQKLDYKPVAFASQNRQVRTHTMGVVFIHVGEAHMGRMTFEGLAQAAHEAGYDLLVRALPHRLSEDESAALRGGGRLLDRLLDRRCDGYIFVGYAPRLLEWLHERQVPVVSCYSGDVPSGVPVVMPDHELSMRQAVKCLYDAGHRRIGHLAGPQWLTGARLRREGFEQAAHELRLLPEEAPVAGAEREGDDWGLSDKGIAAVESLLQSGVTALVAPRDAVAIELKDWLEKRGLNVPNDISLIGVDAEPLSAEAQITTIDLDFAAVGRQAFDTLQRLEAGVQFFEPLVVPSRLIERGSVAAPREN